MTTLADVTGNTIAETTGNVASMASQVTGMALQAAPNLITAGVILVGGIWLAGRAERGANSMLSRQRGIDAMLRGVLARLARYVVLIIMIVAALGQLGIQTTSLLAALGAIGLAVALALQGTLANVAAGFMLLWLRPFKIDDFIEVESNSGTVADVGLFATTMVTVEGLYVFVPNGEIWNKRIVNFSRLPHRMVRETFTISYDDDIEKGREVLLSVASNDPRVHTNPEPTVKVVELGDNAVELELRAWTDTSDNVRTKWDLIEQGKVGLEAAGLTIPYPQRDVHVHGVEGKGNSVALAR